MIVFLASNSLSSFLIRGSFVVDPRAIRDPLSTPPSRPRRRAGHAAPDEHPTDPVEPTDGDVLIRQILFEIPIEAIHETSTRLAPLGRAHRRRACRGAAKAAICIADRRPAIGAHPRRARRTGKCFLARRRNALLVHIDRRPDAAPADPRLPSRHWPRPPALLPRRRDAARHHQSVPL